MNSTATAKGRRRTYRQAARAEAAQITGRRIVAAFARSLETDWVEDITLDQVAREAKVSVQTVIRRFGGKQGLVEAVVKDVDRQVRGVRGVPRGDLRTAVANLCADYEATGEMVLRLLAQEERYPAFKPFIDYGRRE